MQGVGHSARPVGLATGRRRIREMSPPLGLAEALGRAERVISRQVGRLLAIRSAPALFGSSDRDDVEVLHDRADRLDRVLALCPGDDVVHVVRAALDVGRRAIDAGTGRLFVGGTTHDVASEIERVIEHLAVVIGAVTPAERNRLVVDAQLLGLDHDRGRTLVDELINDAGVDSDGRPEELRDQTATVVVSAHGFRLAPAMCGSITTKPRSRVSYCALRSPSFAFISSSGRDVRVHAGLWPRWSGSHGPGVLMKVQLGALQATVECCSRTRIELASIGELGVMETTSPGVRLRS